MLKPGIKNLAKTIITIFVCFMFFSFSSAFQVNAQFEAGIDDPPVPSMEKFEVSEYLKVKGAQSYLDEDSKQKVAIGKFIVDFIVLLTKIIGSFALLVIIVGGITIMISAGNQNLQTKGKEMIKFAIMGLIIAFMSLIIVTFVQSLFYTY